MIPKILRGSLDIVINRTSRGAFRQKDLQLFGGDSAQKYERDKC